MTNPEVLETIEQVAQSAQALEEIIYATGLPQDGRLIGDHSTITPTEEAMLRNLLRQSKHLGATALSARTILKGLE